MTEFALKRSGVCVCALATTLVIVYLCVHKTDTMLDFCIHMPDQHRQNVLLFFSFAAIWNFKKCFKIAALYTFGACSLVGTCKQIHSSNPAYWIYICQSYASCETFYFSQLKLETSCCHVIKIYFQLIIIIAPSVTT